MRTRLTPRTEWQRWLVVWFLFTAIGGAWGLATPVTAVPDEPAHVIYAAAAVRGELWAPTTGTETRVTVPAGLADANNVPGCFAFSPEVTPACSPALAAKPGEGASHTSAGRYPPLYYLYAGLGSLVVDGAKAVYLMRALTAALVGALLASAVCGILRLRRRAMALLGVGLSSTPMLFFFAGGVNPQAPEIAAAVCLWVSGALLLRGMAADPARPVTWRDPMFRRTILSAATLSVMRPVSPAWVLVIVAVLLIALADRTTVRRLLRSRAMVGALPLVVAAAGSTAFWSLARHAIKGNAVTDYATIRRSQALLTSTGKLNDELREMVGVFGWLDTAAPGWTYIVYTLVLGAVIAVALPRLSRRHLVSLVLTVAVTLVIPVVAEMTSFRDSGFAWQGRYTMPIAVGIPLLLGLLPGAPRDRVAPETSAWSVQPVHVSVFAGALVSIHVAAYVGTVNRFMRGDSKFWFVDPATWHPPVPALLLVAGFVVVVVAAGVAVHRLGFPGVRGLAPVTTPDEARSLSSPAA